MGDFVFYLIIILLTLNLCYGNHIRVHDAQGLFIDCENCTPFGVTSGLILDMESKSRNDNLKKLVVAGKVEKDDSNAPCLRQKVESFLQEISIVIMETFPELMKKKFVSRKLLTLSSDDQNLGPAFAPIPAKLVPPDRSVRSPKLLLPPPAPPPLPHNQFPPPLAPNVNQPPPIYQNPIPVPAFPPKPTITSPPVNSPKPVIKKSTPPPLPPHSPVPVHKPEAPTSPPISSNHKTPPASPFLHPVKPNPEKPNTPPVPTSHKPVPAPVPSKNPPVLHPPAVSPVHNSASPPPAPPTTTPTPPRKKQFYRIPKAPPIPQLPPVPTVPRRYFNSPIHGSEPSGPPF